MYTLKAWPNLKFLGEFNKIPSNVFKGKLDHCVDFSELIRKMLVLDGIAPARVDRKTVPQGNHGLIITHYYELIYHTEEDATHAKLMLGEQLGYHVPYGES